MTKRNTKVKGVLFGIFSFLFAGSLAGEIALLKEAPKEDFVPYVFYTLLALMLLSVLIITALSLNKKRLLTSAAVLISCLAICGSTTAVVVCEKVVSDTQRQISDAAADLNVVEVAKLTRKLSDAREASHWAYISIVAVGLSTVAFTACGLYFDGTKG